MTQPFLALITPLSGNYPDNTLPQPQPPTGGGGGNYPSHPIYYPPYPDQGLPPFPSQGLPGSQPRPDQGLPPFPSHPIAPGGGGQPVYPDQGLPGGQGGRPTHPIYLPVAPAHPIVVPPPYPDQGLPGDQPRPDNTLPLPGLPPVTEDGNPIEWKAAWLPQTGWIVVGIPQFPHPVPAK